METNDMELDIADDAVFDQLATYDFVHNDLHKAWLHAVLVLNTFENAEMNDSAQEFALIVAKLSQQLAHCEIMIEAREKYDAEVDGG